MGARDMMPFANALGQYSRVLNGPMNAGETFARGEPVFVNADGEVAGFPADASPGLLSDMTGDGLLFGVALNGPGDGFNNPRTGLAYTTGADIVYVPGGPGQYFITNYIWSTATAVVAPGTAVGNVFAITAEGSPAHWGIDLADAGAATDAPIARVIRIYDSLGRTISATDTTTGVSVMFELLLTAQHA